MFNKKRVSLLLSQGIPQHKVASIVGCSPALISQKLSSTDPNLLDQEFIDLCTVANAEAEKLDVETVAVDGKYLLAEHALLDQMLNIAPSAELRDVTGALRVLNDRKGNNRTIVPTQTSPTEIVVTLNLPGHIHTIPAPIIDITPTKEIIAIDGKNLQPLASKSVQKLFRKMSNTVQGEGDVTSRDVESPSKSVKEALSRPTDKVSIVAKVKDSFLQSSKTFAEC